MLISKKRVKKVEGVVMGEFPMVRVGGDVVEVNTRRMPNEFWLRVSRWGKVSRNAVGLWLWMGWRGRTHWRENDEWKEMGWSSGVYGRAKDKLKEMGWIVEDHEGVYRIIGGRRVCEMIGVRYRSGRGERIDLRRLDEWLGALYDVVVRIIGRKKMWHWKKSNTRPRKRVGGNRDVVISCRDICNSAGVSLWKAAEMLRSVKVSNFGLAHVGYLSLSGEERIRMRAMQRSGERGGDWWRLKNRVGVYRF